MKHRFLVPGAIALVAPLATTACSSSSSSGPALSTSSPSAVVSRATAVPTGPFALGRGEGFDASGAFLSLMTCDSPHDFSPALTFKNVPVGTAELALSMVDLNNHKIHWLQVGLPATAPGTKAHILTPGARELLNDLGEATYDGPCPPTGQTHRYQLTLYALRTPLPASFGRDTAPSQALEQLRSHADATAVLVAPYTRK
ncbi:YbhB/YbcL family Raf kinase inhibitor-like protein [Streptomyces sp. NPDC056161]|uniref:YbhB/YbcL family Raf kinase inhibitor-like protein n=1 Tax=Streptomyces sp. NPDC056161 TaxID=3345732 RepID=UPI0035D6E854